MKKSRFTNEHIAFALKQAESGTPIEEVCRKLGVSQQTFYRWKKKFGDMGVTELRKLKSLVRNTSRKPAAQQLFSCIGQYGVNMADAFSVEAFAPSA